MFRFFRFSVKLSLVLCNAADMETANIYVQYSTNGGLDWELLDFFVLSSDQVNFYESWIYLV